MATSSKKVLIIEDEKPMAKALELKLLHSGFEVKVVSNGEEGLKLIKEESFDFILLDLIMPKMDGFEVLKNLNDQKNSTPVIVLSNLSQEEDAKKAKELGAKEFFIKSNTPIADIIDYIKNTIK